MNLPKTILLIVCTLATHIAMSQNQEKQLYIEVYFDNDEHEISETEKQKILGTLDSFHLDSLIKITLRGHTDNVADSAYNIALSKRRTKSVKLLLLDNKVPNKKIRAFSYGEDKPKTKNTTSSAKQSNRRVELRIRYLPSIVDTSVVSEIDSCQTDTTVTFENGVRLTFNQCEYEKIKDCIEVNVVTNSEEVIDQNISLQDNRGFSLASCGMITIQKKSTCGSDPCFEFPVIVQIPVKDSDTVDKCNPCLRRANTYTMENGRWTPVSGKKVRLVLVDSMRFFQIEVPCANQFTNCDCKLKGPKAVIKVRGKYTIDAAEVYGDCPLFRTQAREAELGKKQVAIDVPCSDAPKYLSLIVSHKDGRVVQLRKRELNTFTKRVWWPICRPDGAETEYHRTIAGKRKKQATYRKYIVRKRDIPE